MIAAAAIARAAAGDCAIHGVVDAVVTAMIALAAGQIVDVITGGKDRYA